MKYTKKYFKSGNNKLRYFEFGVGKPVLFLHGGGISALTYKNILELLAEKYLVIAPDLPCFGESTCPESTDEYFAIMDKFTKHLGFEKLAVIGHSIGGVVALHLAAGNSNIRRLVLVDAVGIAQDVSGAKFLNELLLKKTLHDFVLYKNFRALLMVGRDVARNSINRIFQWRKIIAIMQDLLTRDFIDFDKIDARTLILWGRQDELFPKNSAEIFHEKIKRSKLKFETSNHDGCLFNPKKFSSDIIDWLELNHY